MAFCSGIPPKIVLLVTMTVLYFRVPCVSGQFPMSIDPVNMYHEIPKRSLATICVEIRPNGPTEEPYYMCRGADLPPFPKLLSGNSETTPKSTAPTYADNGSYGANYNNYNNYKTTNNGNKESNSKTTAQGEFFPQFPRLQGSENNGNMPSKSSSTDNPDKSNPQLSSPGNKSSDQFKSVSPSEYNQNFPPPQQQYSPSPQQAKQQQPLFNPEHMIPGFHPNFFFRPPFETKPIEATKDFKGYDSIFVDNVNEKPPKQSTNPSSYNSQQPNTFGTAPSSPFYKHKASDVSSYTPLNNGYKSSKHGLTTPESGEEYGKSTVKSSAAEGTPFSTTYNGQHPGSKAIHGGYDEPKLGKPLGHNRGGSYPNKSNVPTIQTTDVKAASSFPKAPYVDPGFARAPHPAPIRFSMHATAKVAPDERSEVSFLGGSNVPKPSQNFVRKGTKFSNEGFRPTLTPNGLGPQPLHLQTAPPYNQPTVNRHRTMIDDDVLQLPNWGFHPDEFDLFRSTPIIDDIRINVSPASIYTPSRVIPLDYLEDPVMRTFYSSLPDVGPLPIIRPPVALGYPSNQPQQVASYTQKSTQKTLYQQPYGCPNSYQRNPQFYNYNPCPPPREYNVQPVFIAMPCFGQPMYQPMMTPSSGGQLGMANPLSDPLSRLLTIGDPVKHFLTSPQTAPAPTSSPALPPLKMKPQLINNRKESKDMQTKTVSTSTVATSIDIDSNESAESVEETRDPTPLKDSKNNNLKTSHEAASGSSGLKKATSVQPETTNFETNLSDTSRSTTQRTSADVLGASQLVTTQAPIDRSNSEEDAEEISRTTFRSLIATARRLAQMVRTSKEENFFNMDSSTQTPSPKKQRHASKNLTGGNGGGKRKSVPQTN